MIKIILFDCDGLIIKHEKYFNQRMLEQKGIQTDAERQKLFFNNEFLLCETGKADLKQELSSRLNIWNWQGSTEELMDFWFSGESTVDARMKDYIVRLREKGIKCFLSTNNEKYRTEYLWDVICLKSFLDGLFSSGYLGYLKPEVRFWQEVCKDFPDISKEEILVWDDQESTIHSAKEYGLNAEFYEGFESFKKIMSDKYQLS